MSIARKLETYLNKHKVPYEIIHHHRDYTAQQAAADTHTKGRDFAKTVILWVDNDYCMAVVPATHQIDIDKVKAWLHAKEVNLASEEELKMVCSDCEVGAMPPIGQLYKLPVYVSHLLIEDHLITFNAGTHEDAIRMPYRYYDELVQPRVLDLTMN